MKCCDQELKTPFCPHCGAKGGVSSLAILVSYLRTHQRSCENDLSRAERLREQYKANGSDMNRFERRLASLARCVEKWKGWADGVEELLSEKGNP